MGGGNEKWKKGILYSYYYYYLRCEPALDERSGIACLYNRGILHYMERVAATTNLSWPGPTILIEETPTRTSIII